MRQRGDAWEHLRSGDEVPVGVIFSGCVSADANVVTTEVLDDEPAACRSLDDRTWMILLMNLDDLVDELG